MATGPQAVFVVVIVIGFLFYLSYESGTHLNTLSCKLTCNFGVIISVFSILHSIGLADRAHHDEFGLC